MAGKHKTPPRETRADATASGWKPPFPGALPPFRKPPAAKKPVGKLAPKPR